MKAKHIIWCIVICFIACAISFLNRAKYAGEICQKEIAERTKIQAADADLLHLIYKSDLDYWYNVIMESEEYATLDSLKQGDWEDFYLY